MFSNRYTTLKVDGIKYNTKNIVNTNTNTNTKRGNAFNILSNKGKLKYQLNKTKMCNRYDCDGNNCSYAHSDSELKIRDCLFGEECIYQNSKNKMCKFIHPNESVENYKKRISNNNIIKKIIL
jgi:hypothetical protein